MKTFHIIIGIVIILITGFIFLSYNNFNNQQNNKETIKNNNENFQKSEIVDWRSAELTDIITKEEFNINQFDKPVLLESFAVWCPTCTKQQNEIKKLHEEIGEDVISISLDTDPNEDEKIVSKHITSNGFDWHYAISSPEITNSLIDEFGVNVVNAPQSPVILICQDGSARLLKNGVKTSSELKKEINKC